jgi:hypothetical protein
MNDRWRRLLREPMVHFVAAGAVLFAIHAALAPDVPAATRGDDEARTIVVSRAFVDELARAEARRTGRTPGEAERAALIDRWLEEELLVREAAALGLGRGDPIVRRRLVQKMEFLLDDAGVAREPTDEELAAWMAAREERYREPERWTFTQAFFRSEAEAAEALANSASTSTSRDLERAGVGFPLGRRFVRRSHAEIASMLGEGFADSIARIDVAGAWTGPTRSAQGFHLVRIDERIPARLPGVGEMRAKLRADWLADRRENARREALRTLRAQVRVVEEP